MLQGQFGCSTKRQSRRYVYYLNNSTFVPKCLNLLRFWHNNTIQIHKKAVK